MKKNNLTQTILIVAALFLSGCANYKPSTFDNQTKRYNDYKYNYSIEVLDGYGLLSSDAKKNLPNAFLNVVPEDAAVFYNKQNESMIITSVSGSLAVKNEQEKKTFILMTSELIGEKIKKDPQARDFKVSTTENATILEGSVSTELGDGKIFMKLSLFPLSRNSTDHGVFIISCCSKLKNFEETKKDYLKMSDSLLLTAFPESQRIQNSPKSPERIVEATKPINSSVRELPHNIKKAIATKCSSDFPSDYVQQSECVKKQESAWSELNQSGAVVGNEMDKQDRKQLNDVYERGVSGQHRSWQNPNSGIVYTVTPQPAVNGSSGPCRKAEIRAVIDGKPETTISITACRKAGGQWVVQ